MVIITIGESCGYYMEYIYIYGNNMVILWYGNNNNHGLMVIIWISVVVNKPVIIQSYGNHVVRRW